MKLNDEGPLVGELQKYLERFGYLFTTGVDAEVTTRTLPPHAKLNRFDRATETALKVFQKRHGLKVTGRLDRSTQRMIRRPRCGVPDRPYGRAASFAASGSSWSNTRLTYSFANLTTDLDAATIKASVKLALRRWALVCPLSFEEVSSGGDIEIKFATGDHGDSNPFDGPLGVLAHAFYPPPPGSRGGAIFGDAHFDDDEDWSVDVPPTGIDLPSSALHELGHSLGLDHSAVKTAVMFDTYSGPLRELTGDDIDGIRSIYGTRERTIWSGIDAAIEGQLGFAGKAYFLKAGQYLRFDWADDLVDPSYPKPIAGNWPGLPADFTTNLDAALNGQGRWAGKLYLFKGDQYARYDWATDRADPGYPRPIAGSWPGLPAGFTRDFDAAVSGVGPFAGKAYFFKGSQYVRYDWATDRADANYPAPIASNWRGLPAGFTSSFACVLNGSGPVAGKVYLFKGSQYVRYDWATDRADPGTAGPIELNWF